VVALEEWREEHGDAAAFVLLAASTLLSGMLAAYMNFSERGAEQAYVTEVFGSRLYLTPVGTGVLLTGLIAGEVYLVFRIERTRSAAEGIVLFSFALLAGMLALLFTRTFAYSYFPLGGGLLVLMVASGVFISIYLTFLILIGEYSDGMKNLVLLIFSGTTGAFFSLLMPTSAMAVILLIVVGVDVVMTYARAREPQPAEPLKLSVTTRRWGIGMGDLIVFSMVTDKALVSMGDGAYALSILLLFSGMWMAMRLARSGDSRMLPGTLLVALPASIPIFLMLFLG